MLANLQIEEMHRQCLALYDVLSEKACQVQANQVREDLPIRPAGRSRFEFLPATSLAIQSLVPADSGLHHAIMSFREDMDGAFPAVSESTFWQPPGTFHHNVAVLIRLTIGHVEGTVY